MLVRCTMSFRDLETPGRPMRAVGEEWEATPERLQELANSRYGVLAVEVPERAAEPARASRKAEPAAPTADAPTADELEAMTNRQLVELCIREGVETSGRPRKAELVAALKSFYGLE